LYRGGGWGKEGVEEEELGDETRNRTEHSWERLRPNGAGGMAHGREPGDFGNRLGG